MRPLLVTIFALFLAGIGGCFSATAPDSGVAGGDPAAPPGPPAEIPTSLRIPKDLGLDLEKVQAALVVASEGGTGPKSAVAPDGEFSDEVAGLTDTVQFFTEALSGLLDPYNQLLIPVGTNIKTFQGVSVVQGEGELEFVEFKADFSDFDFDGDGKKEGCSGHTAGLPICMRFYADGEKQIAAVFTEFPTETNPGAGRLMGLNVTHGVFLFPKGDFLGITYDVHDPSEGRSIDLQLRENPANLEGGDRDLKFHLALDQQGEESTALKTVNVNFTMNDGGPRVVQVVARWREDQDLWSGTIRREEPESGLTELTNQCVNLLTGDGAGRIECIDLGVDVGTLAFPPLPDETTLFLPEDFPEFPPP
jgi:hypothetical protein